MHMVGGQTVRELSSPFRAHLMPGDWVEVRTEAEILATLDADGTLDHLPFMPEMRRFIGRHFRVRARADRTFAENRGLRSMADTVHLEGAHCDGGAHDGCCRACVVFWKEAWLRRISDSSAPPPPPAGPRRVHLKTREEAGEDARAAGYFCQATRLHVASEPLRLRHVRRHLSALWNENLDPVSLGRSIVIAAHDAVQLRVLRGNAWTVVSGTCDGKTPSASLNLEPGERVRVKSEREILPTLDKNGKNRGLEFSREMLRFCGHEFTVLRRCEQLIRDDPPKMVRLRDTVILDGLDYEALSILAIPRREYFFWRECWLERVKRRDAT
jgi:hypothetical protein